MASAAQVLANRRNAQKSTGPRTEEGKAVAAQNAVKHGLLARDDVIKTEDQGDFDRMREKVLGELAPAGPVETPLAERIVSLMWRLKRAQRLQNEVFDYLLARDADVCARRVYCNSADDPRGDPEFGLGRVVVEDLSKSRVIERLELYERRIESSLYRTMRELRTVKKQRAEDGERRAACEDAAGRVGTESPGGVTPYGVTTNGPGTLGGDDKNGEMCETKPICLGVEGCEGREKGETVMVGAALDPAA